MHTEPPVPKRGAAILIHELKQKSGFPHLETTGGRLAEQVKANAHVSPLAFYKPAWMRMLHVNLPAPFLPRSFASCPRILPPFLPPPPPAARFPVPSLSPLRPQQPYDPFVARQVVSLQGTESPGGAVTSK